MRQKGEENKLKSLGQDEKPRGLYFSKGERGNSSGLVEGGTIIGV